MLQCHEGRDKLEWKPNGGKTYSIASCYEVLRRRKVRVQWASMVWSTGVMSRHSFIWWLTIHMKLKTRVFLQSRGMQISAECCFCNHDGENVSHIFFNCQFSKQIWKEVLVKMNIKHTPRSWELEWHWVQTRFKGRAKQKKILRATFAFTIYQIWIERNSRLFTNVSKQST